MSKRLRFLLGAVAVTAASQSATAQSLEQLRADSVKIQQALRDLQVKDSLRHSAWRRESVSPMSAGLFSFQAAPSQHAALRVAAERATQRLHDAYGDAVDSIARALKLSTRADTNRFSATLMQRVRGIDTQWRYSLVVDDGGRGTQNIPVGVAPSASDYGAAIEDAVQRALARVLGESFTRLAGGAPRMERIPKALWSDLVRATITSSAVGRRCLTSDSNACAEGMGLLPVRDPFSDWYEPMDWPMLYSQLAPSDRDFIAVRVGSDRWLQCTTGDVRACTGFERFLDRSHLRPPFPVMARQALVRVAMDRGRADGLRRLQRAGNAAVPEQLSALAGEPFSDLLKHFREQLVASKPASPSPSLVGVFAALVWLTLALALSLRSAPWLD